MFRTVSSRAEQWSHNKHPNEESDRIDSVGVEAETLPTSSDRQLHHGSVMGANPMLWRLLSAKRVFSMDP